jgi:16S rRNA (cytosine967-C5)-methyltransferase
MADENVRAVAARIINSLSQGKGSLTGHIAAHQDHADYSYLRELCFGTCRQYFLLEGILRQLAQKPIKAKDNDLRCLLLIGLYQLRELATADYAAINETVNAVNELGKGWAKGFVNGVLRNFQRDPSRFDKHLSAHEKHAFPNWLFLEIEASWPEQSQTIFTHSNLRPPLTLRINTAKTSRQKLLAEFAEQQIAAHSGRLTDTAIYLEQARSVQKIPGFDAGLVSVQDEASQLVPALLDLQAGQRVLDACAAPGGKTCHILESEQSLTEVVALDVDERRLTRIEENLQRLGLAATLVTSDASDVDAWWDGRFFDRILLDAPCSATGVIRRHPDIKLLRTPEEVQRLQQIQQSLLQRLWPTLTPGGLLLYTTCSILPGENEEQISRFLSATGDAKYQGITADWGVECRYGRQLLTGTEREPDGFYYALLRKE